MVHTARLSFNTLLLSLFCFAAFGQNEYPDVWQKSVEQSLRATHFHVFKGKKVYVFNALNEEIEVVKKSEFETDIEPFQPDWVQELSEADKHAYNQEGSYLILNEKISRYTSGALPYQIRNLNGDVLLDFDATNCCVRIGEFHEGLAILYLYPCNYAHATPYLTAWFGYIDADGKLIVPPRLSVKKHFTSGMNQRFQGAENWQMHHGLCLRMERDSAYYFMDKTGTKVLPKDGYYTLATAFNEQGFARVYRSAQELKEHKEVWINTAGKAVTDGFENGSLQILPNRYLIHSPPKKNEKILLDPELREVYRLETKNDSTIRASFNDFYFRDDNENKSPDELFVHRIDGKSDYFGDQTPSFFKIVGFSGKEYSPWINTALRMDISSGVFYSASYKERGKAILSFTGDTLFKHDSCRINIFKPGLYEVLSTNPHRSFADGKTLAYVNYRGDVMMNYEDVPAKKFEQVSDLRRVAPSMMLPTLHLQFDETTLQKVFDENMKKDPVQIRR